MNILNYLKWISIDIETIPEELLEFLDFIQSTNTEECIDCIIRNWRIEFNVLQWECEGWFIGKYGKRPQQIDATILTLLNTIWDKCMEPYK